MFFQHAVTIPDHTVGEGYLKSTKRRNLIKESAKTHFAIVDTILEHPSTGEYISYPAFVSMTLILSVICI